MSVYRPVFHIACDVAIAMCGDVAEGIELALGSPQPTHGGEPVLAWRAELANVDPSPSELEEYTRLERERECRLQATALHQLAETFSTAAWHWSSRTAEALRAGADAILAEALAIVVHDSVFIHVKLSRALDGRDRFATGESDGRDPVQNDWNGSAKVALISIERSLAAWHTIADAASDAEAAAIAEQLEDVRQAAVAEFPRAMEFVRPGFDASPPSA